MNTVDKMEKIWDGAGGALSGRSLETVRLEAKIEELKARVDKYVLYTERRLGDLMDRLDRLEENAIFLMKVLERQSQVLVRRIDSDLNLEVDE